MTIEFACPYCETTLRTADDRAGWQARCPSCSAIIDVPELDWDSHPEDDDFLEWDTAADPAASSPPVSGSAEPGDPELSIPRPSRHASAFQRRECPMCGTQVPVSKRFCPDCGEPLRFRSSQPAPAASPLRPNRAVLVVILGLAGWMLCPVFSVVAWVIANQDLAGIREGVVNPDGEIAIRLGRIIAAAHVIIVGTVFLVACLLPMLLAAL